MDKTANGRKEMAADAATGEVGARTLDLNELRQSPGFMIRILQLEIFERFYAFFESKKLSPVGYAILLIVRDNDNVTQSELAAALKMQLPNVVKILSNMESEGTLRRKRSSRDKRAVELSLTAAGLRRANEANRLGQIFNSQTLAAFNRQEQAIFLQMLGRLLEGYKRVVD